MEEKELKRLEELSNKLFEMSQSLRTESLSHKDESLATVANIIMLISGIMTNKSDLSKVADLLAMFSAKKILDSTMISNLNFDFEDNGVDDEDDDI